MAWETICSFVHYGNMQNPNILGKWKYWKFVQYSILLDGNLKRQHKEDNRAGQDFPGGNWSIFP